MRLAGPSKPAQLPPFPRHPRCTPDRPLIVGSVPGCFQLQRFGATDLRVHADVAPATAREVSLSPGEAFAVSSLLSPRRRGRAWLQGLLGPQNRAISKERPSSRHPVKTRWGPGPGWGLPGTAPRLAHVPPGLHHVAGGQPAFQSPVSGRDTLASTSKPPRCSLEVVLLLKTRKVWPSQTPRGPDSPGQVCGRWGSWPPHAPHPLPGTVPSASAPGTPRGLALGFHFRGMRWHPGRWRASAADAGRPSNTCSWEERPTGRVCGRRCQPAGRHPCGHQALARPGPLTSSPDAGRATPAGRRIPRHLHFLTGEGGSEQGCVLNSRIGLRTENGFGGLMPPVFKTHCKAAGIETVW